MKALRSAGLGLVLFAAGVAPAGAQTPTIYYGCYVPLTGTVYRIKEANLKPACTSGHVEFSWNSQGPAGQNGADGATGLAGGIAGLEIVRKHVDVSTLNTAIDLTSFTWHHVLEIRCPAPKIVISGGYELIDPKLVFSVPSGTSHLATRVVVDQSRPVAPLPGLGTFHGWLVSIRVIFGAISPAVPVAGYAVCANPN
jgi:hypothetical protein